MNLGPHLIAVCSWSLKPKDASDLAALVKQTGLAQTQLALNPLLSLDTAGRRAYFKTLRDGGVEVVSGMVGFPGEDYKTIAMIRATGGFMPDAEWPKRRQLVIDAGRAAIDNGVKTITTHVGFVPNHRDAKFKVAVERIGQAVRELGKLGVTLLFETGQERDEDLLELLNTIGATNAGVNFDPANMILYGAGDPVAAVRKLGTHILQVHIKDATASAQPGEAWGAEVAFGQGQVPHQAFAEALQDVGYRGPLVIEREAGDKRLEDVKIAIATLRRTV